MMKSKCVIHLGSGQGLSRPTAICRGFSLVELMVVIAIIGILASIAMPNYQDYLSKGKIAEASANLSQMRMKIEQRFADTNSYVGYDCAVPGERTYFTYTCPTLTATTYVIQADGRADKGMGGYTYKIDQANARRSITPALTAEISCWATRRSGSC